MSMSYKSQAWAWLRDLGLKRERWKIDADLSDVVESEQPFPEHKACLGSALVLAEVLAELEQAGDAAGCVLGSLKDQAVTHAQQRGSSLREEAAHF